MSDKHDLELILGSHIPLLTIETYEEYRALSLIKSVVSGHGKRLCQWSVTEGLHWLIGSENRVYLELEPVTSAPLSPTPPRMSTNPEAMLRSIKKEIEPTVFVLLDFHPFLVEPTTVRLIKEIALDHTIKGHSLIFISHEITLPPEITRYSAKFSLNMPNEAALEKIVADEAKVWALKNKGMKLKADQTAMQMLIRNLLGLSVTDATRLIRGAIFDDGAITENDLPDVQKAKYELLSQDGILSFEYDTVSFAEVGGLKNLKLWLDKRRHHFVQLQPNSIDTPKGILLLGVQGGGKSLAAKAVAGVWGLPLLRIDFGAVYNKFFGETEKNIREALKLAETMAPCVLWVDEIEKGIAAGDYDSGTSRRVLATLLTWMAERKAPVFLVATANNIRSLPPELIRKGRLDEIFFVDLPTHEVRQDIFAIHLSKRNFDPTQFDLQQLATATDAFSGSEIEQAVVAALYSASAQASLLTTDIILAEIKQTRPLAVVMSEDIAELRRWAVQRTVAAE